MLKQNFRIPSRPNNLLIQIIVACSFGLLLGIGCGLLSGLLVLALLAAGIGIYAALKRPEIALLAILIATSSVVFEDQLPQFSAGGISLHIPDLLLLGLLALIVLRWVGEPGFRIARTPLDWPLLIFYSLTLLSTFIAIYHSSVDVLTARRLIRVMTYYMTFFVVTNLVRERRQLNLLLNGLFLLATFVAAAMILQSFLGTSSAFLPGRVEALNTEAVVYGDVTRILPPGISIVLITFFTTFCILAIEKIKTISWMTLLQFGLLGMGVLFTFLRSYWVALLMVVFLLVFILSGRERQKLINWFISILLFVAVIFLLVYTIQDSKAVLLVGASRDRLNTVFNIGTYQGQDSSVNWRAIEDEYALRQIVSEPLIGSGLGSLYRPFDPRLDQGGEDLRGYIHNGHLETLLDSGLLGYLSLIWLSLAFLIRGFRYWRSVADDRLRGIVLGFTLAYLAVLIAAVANSTFTMWQWTPVIGIIMGINEVILMRFKDEAPVA